MFWFIVHFIRLIHVCLSNDEVEPQWMAVLETESVFKNFIYILENSLNGKTQEVCWEIGIHQPDMKSTIIIVDSCFDSSDYKLYSTVNYTVYVGWNI